MALNSGSFANSKVEISRFDDLFRRENLVGKLLNRFDSAATSDQNCVGDLLRSELSILESSLDAIFALIDNRLDQLLEQRKAEINIKICTRRKCFYINSMRSLIICAICMSFFDSSTLSHDSGLLSGCHCVVTFIIPDFTAVLKKSFVHIDSAEVVIALFCNNLEHLLRIFGLRSYAHD